jgi:hypothetical protein
MANKKSRVHWYSNKIKKYKDAIERINLDTEEAKEEDDMLIPTANINSSMEAEKATEIEDNARS